MKRVREIAEAIQKLSPEEHRHLIEWFEEQHWKHAASAKLEEAHVEESGTDEGDDPGGPEDEEERER